jgi:hypothetical protein
MVVFPGTAADLGGVGDPDAGGSALPGDRDSRFARLAVTHRYKRTHYLWLEQFQIADYLQRSALGRRFDIKHRSSCSGYHQQPAPA